MLLVSDLTSATSLMNTIFIVMSFNWIGEIEEVIFEARLMRKLDTSDFSEDAEFINGLQSHEVEIQRHVPLDKAKV